jgi:2-polyprenyl-3-methyl-5-hydroxy-6-metoxy-1,4-benzoquinol methylase
MNNILDEKPARNLTGRLLASVNFVSNEDLKDKDILNIGCGFGWCELNFLDRGIKKMAGIEITEKDLKVAQENIVSEKIEFCIGSADNIPFVDCFFDTVVSWEVIEHIPKNSECRMFGEVYRVLKPGGTFYLSTPNASFFSNVMDPAWWLIGHRHYSEKKLTQIAMSEGFKIVDVKIKGGFWVLFSTLNMYIAKWIFRRRRFLNEVFGKKENIEYQKDSGFANIFIKFKKDA